MSKHPFLWFYILALLIPLIMVGTYVIFPYPYEIIHGGPVDYQKVYQEAEEKAGVDASTTKLLPTLRISLKEPVLFTTLIGSAAPAIAGLLMAALLFGRSGFRELISRFKPWRNGVTWREGLKVYGLAILTMTMVALCRYVFKYLWGGDVRGDLIFDIPPIFSIAFLWALLQTMFLDRGALLEETGWRGYALPLLQEKMRSPLAATIFLGFMWGLWHVPRDIADGRLGAIGVFQWLFIALPLFLIGCISLSIIITYFYNRTGGSTIVAIMLHGFSNDSMRLSGNLPFEFQYLIPHAATRVTAELIAAILIIWVAGKSLGLNVSEEQIKKDMAV